MKKPTLGRFTTKLHKQPLLGIGFSIGFKVTSQICLSRPYCIMGVCALKSMTGTEVIDEAGVSEEAPA